jgi:hypothetical protein
MNSILEHLRKTWNLDTNEEQCGVACGRRWAMTSAVTAELCTLAALSTCPSFAWWFDDINGQAVITRERLVCIIGAATHSSLESVDFWNQYFGDSDKHIAISRTPAFTRGFVAGAVEVWNRRRELRWESPEFASCCPPHVETVPAERMPCEFHVDN